MYPVITDGSVLPAPRPSSMPNSLAYGETSALSASQPVDTPTARPAAPLSSARSSTSSGSERMSASDVHDSGFPFAMQTKRSMP